MKHIELQDMAFNSFNNTIAGVGANAQSDKWANNVLEKLYGASKYRTVYEKSDDPLWQIVHNLTKAQCRELITGCKKIREMYCYKEV